MGRIINNNFVSFCSVEFSVMYKAQRLHVFLLITIHNFKQSTLKSLSLFSDPINGTYFGSCKNINYLCHCLFLTLFLLDIVVQILIIRTWIIWFLCINDPFMQFFHNNKCLFSSPFSAIRCELQIFIVL